MEIENYHTINALSRMLERDPRTLKKHIASAKIKPHSDYKLKGQLTYSVADAAQATYANVNLSKVDPDELSPLDRKYHYETEDKKIEILKKQGELINVDDARVCFNHVARIFIDATEMLTTGCVTSLDSEQQDKIEEHVREVRQHISEMDFESCMQEELASQET